MEACDLLSVPKFSDTDLLIKASSVFFFYTRLFLENISSTDFYSASSLESSTSDDAMRD